MKHKFIKLTALTLAVLWSITGYNYVVEHRNELLHDVYYMIYQYFI